MPGVYSLFTFIFFSIFVFVTLLKLYLAVLRPYICIKLLVVILDAVVTEICALDYLFTLTLHTNMMV